MRGGDKQIQFLKVVIIKMWITNHILAMQILKSYYSYPAIVIFVWVVTLSFRGVSEILIVDLEFKIWNVIKNFS